MEKRPVIIIHPSQLDKTIELISKILLLIMWILAVFTFINMPAIVPVHFGASGKPDDYGSKATLWILPLLGTIIYFGLTWLNQYPQIFNYPTKITEANAGQQYMMATRMLRFLKAGILLIFTFIILFTYLTATGYANGLSNWFLPLMLVIILSPTSYFIAKSVKKK